MEVLQNKKYFNKINTSIRNGLIFAQRAKMAWNSNGYVDMFCSGPKGIGKTSYGLWNLYACYGDWDLALKHLFFDPTKVLELFDKLNREHQKVPMLVLDDAATHIAKSTWYETDTLNFSKFFNVIRTVASSFIMNGPSEKIPSSMSNDITYITKIGYVSKYMVKQYIEDETCPEHHYWNNMVRISRHHKLNDIYKFRKATLYTKFTLPSGTVRISPNKSYDIYPQFYPNQTFKDYEQIRHDITGKLINDCLHPEDKNKKAPGRPMDNIEISKVIFHTYKSLIEKGDTKNQIWKSIGLPNRGKLRYHLDKYETYLRNKKIEEI